MSKSIFEVCHIDTIKGVIADTVHYKFVEEGIKISDIKSRYPISEAIYAILDTFTASTGIKEFSNSDVRKVRVMVGSAILATAQVIVEMNSEAEAD
jgi:hypothetical protein